MSTLDAIGLAIVRFPKSAMMALQPEALNRRAVVLYFENLSHKTFRNFNSWITILQRAL
jgi:hypothetical protein